jgi:hypothetical protein
MRDFAQRGILLIMDIAFGGAIDLANGLIRWGEDTNTSGI